MVRAVAERLPFRDATFDKALAVLTVHHWQDLEAGLREMIRVARQRVVLLTWNPRHAGFWLTRDYFPEMLKLDQPIFRTFALSKRLLVAHRCTRSRFLVTVPTAFSVHTGGDRQPIWIQKSGAQFRRFREWETRLRGLPSFNPTFKTAPGSRETSPLRLVKRLTSVTG